MTCLLLQAGAVKSKRQRSAGREGSPVEGSRVSKRQKAKAGAQAAEAAQLLEAEEQAGEGDDPFSGAATQVACLAIMQTLLSSLQDSMLMPDCVFNASLPPN
jgi:hypothetical protein